MAHAPKPFFRSARGAWYVQLGKQQVKLAPGPKTGETEKAAWAAFHALMAERAANPSPNSANSAAPGRLSAAGLFDKFLDWCQKNREPGTYGWYRDRVQSFVDSLPDPAGTPAADLRPYHVAEWVANHPGWGDTYRRGAMIAVQRPYNWAAKLGYLDANPLRHLEKPKAKRREQAVTPEEFDTIVASYPDGDPFRALLVFAWETGCRPQEVARLEARHVDLAGMQAAFPVGESKGKRRVRRILLTAAAAAVLKPLLAAVPEGPLFRNRAGRPWTRFAVANRFARLQKLLGVKYAQYSLRHGFATAKLVDGVDHLTVAELMGHADGTMLARTYQHLNQREGHLRAALERGKAKSNAPSEPGGGPDREGA